MNKEYIQSYLSGKVDELQSIKKYISDETAISIIDAKIETLIEIMEKVKLAPKPYELI